MISTPSQESRRTAYQVPTRPFKGLDAIVNSAIGLYRRRSQLFRELRRDAEKIDALAPKYVSMDDAKLHQELMSFREEFRRSARNCDTFLFPAMAALREAADRKLGLRPYLEQLMGALAMHRGWLTEMATGEGKTLTAGLPAVLAGWSRHPCHMITVNDYLVQRDSEWLHPYYSFAGVKVGFVAAPMSPPERQKGYGADVTYTTSKELLADFLRDRLRLGPLTNPSRRLIRHLIAPQMVMREGLVQRGLHTAIVDEADSILIDEAVTPLIISTSHKNDMLKEAVLVAERLAQELSSDADYHIDLRYREIELTKAGQEKLAARCAELPGLWREAERRVELIKQALVAREFFLMDKQYIIQDGKVVIVDEFTGRQMPQRTWREGLHQAIEARQQLPVSDPSETIARLSFQRFFRCFHRLCGMTGTAREAAGEFWQIYRLPVVTIPTHKPCIRKHWPDRVFADENTKWQAIVEDIERVHATGRPILVGTRSVAASERLAAMLTARELEFQLLNAVRHHEEAVIVAMAGEPARITIATNMAGRGTDIKLGHGVAALGGLHVMATERHESGRVDRQLFGRSARQGDAGSAQAFVSGEDELLRRYLPASIRSTLAQTLKLGLPGKANMAKAAFALAQRKAQGISYKQRRAVLRTDTWLEEALSFASPEATV